MKDGRDTWGTCSGCPFCLDADRASRERRPLSMRYVGDGKTASLALERGDRSSDPGILPGHCYIVIVPAKPYVSTVVIADLY